MKPLEQIWTIGHSTHSIENFTGMLNTFNITMLVDVRQFPGSRKFPHFNKENLAISLQEQGISYRHLIELGGRRKSDRESKNIAWRHPAFRSYADYMETDDFSTGIDLLKNIAINQATAYMCSEAVWWRCHRSMISDYLKAEGWKVMHIMTAKKADEHPYTSAATISEGKLIYTEMK